MIKKGRLRDNKGISLITVIITIIVIIILATISYTMLHTQDTAAIAKYVQEFEELRKSVETRRIADAKTGLQDADNTFSKVNVSGEIPYNFIFIDNGGEKEARLVSLDRIGCEEMSTGQDYKRFEREDSKPVVFGEDDVYVYDSTGTLFYAKGFDYNGSTIHELPIDDKGQIQIIRVDKIYDSGAEEVKIIIQIDSTEDIKAVCVGDEEAARNADGNYEAIVNENGTYDILAEDVKGNTDKEKVVVTEIGSTIGDISVSAEVTNSYAYEDDCYKVKGGHVEINIISPNAKYMKVENDESHPTTYFPFYDTIEREYSTPGEKTLYIWVKDEHGNENYCELNILIEFSTPTTPETPSTGDVNGEIDFTVSPNNSTWSKSKVLTINFGEGKQSDGYTSMYRMRNITGWGRWTVSYESEVNIDITRNGTEVEAKITYKSSKGEQNVATENITIEKIDTTPPNIGALGVTSGEIHGSATDGESGLPTKPYLITTQSINFKYVSDIESYEWTSEDSLDVTQNARYYFYARDNVGNVSVASINAESSDKIAPNITSLTTTNIADHANITFTATDNVGVTEYAVTKNDEDTVPTNWIKTDGSKSVTVDNITVDEDGSYTIWVRDDAGNISSKTIIVTLNQLPTISGDYPRNIYTKEGTMVTFNVEYDKSGDPDEYEYKWQVSKDGGSTWSYIRSATNKDYTFRALYEDNNNLYRCEIIHARGNIMSPSAKLEVVRITTLSPNAEAIVNQNMVAGGVIINHGAVSTTNTTLDLEIIAINAEQMSISETTTKGNWVKYKQNTTYELTNTTKGNKAIYVWFKDSNGNVSEYVVNHIELK